MAKSKTPSKKKGAKAPAKKKPVKKVAVKKKAAPKKAVSTRKPAPRVAKKTSPKKTIRRKAVESATKQKTKNKENKKAVEKIETQLPPVEEKTAEVNTSAGAFVPGLDKKSMQQAATRNYDNHHIRLSNRKGGIKPSGKKPLW